MKFTVDINREQFESWFLSELMAQYELCGVEMVLDDREYLEEMRKHLKAVIQYNCSPDKWQEWVENNNE